MTPEATGKPIPTAPLREEHGKILAAVHALGERLEKLHEQTTLEQMSLARDVVDFVKRQIVPHARAEEYYQTMEVAISGDLDGYVRRDMDQPCIEMWRCRTCGILTHWSLLDKWPHDDIPRPDRMGVNARLLDAEVADDLPIQHSDGASQ